MRCLDAERECTRVQQTEQADCQRGSRSPREERDVRPEDADRREEEHPDQRLLDGIELGALIERQHEDPEKIVETSTDEGAISRELERKPEAGHEKKRVDQHGREPRRHAAHPRPQGGRPLRRSRAPVGAHDQPGADASASGAEDHVGDVRVAAEDQQLCQLDRRRHQAPGHEAHPQPRLQFRATLDGHRRPHTDGNERHDVGEELIDDGCRRIVSIPERHESNLPALVLVIQLRQADGQVQGDH